MNNEFEAGPFVRWAGGKAKLINIILQKVEQHINLNDIQHYIEPFVGGGALFFYLAQNYDFKSYTIMDINLELINAYKAIKQSPEKLIYFLDILQENYNRLISLEDKSKYYYEIRSCFNFFEEKEKLKDIVNFERAAQFIFLNKTCFNGLYRVNRAGEYNVPFGKKETINIYNPNNIFAVNQILQKTSIIHGDYYKTLEYIDRKEDTFVYFDPPYRPITSSAFTAYAESGFNDRDQENLAELCKLLYEKNVHFAVSNSDNPEDEEKFFNRLYDNENFQMYQISAPRQIAAKIKSRSTVSEILVIW